MEYCAVQGPVFEKIALPERYDVRKVRGLVLVAVFSTAIAEVQILDLLVDNFLQAVLKRITSGARVLSAVTSACTDMDVLVKEKLKLDILTKDRTLFCAVHLRRKVVYTMGSLPRHPETLPEILASDGSSRTILFTKVRLKPDDRHLVIATEGAKKFMVGEIGPILESRIRRVGLVEACKSIVGKYADIVQKTLIVVTLKKDVHLPYPNQPQLPVGDWEEDLRFLQEIGLHSYRDSDESDSEDRARDRDNDRIDFEDTRRLYKDPRAYLRPLKEDEICQQPEPSATLVYSEWRSRRVGTIGFPRVSEGLSLEPEPESAIRCD